MTTSFQSNTTGPLIRAVVAGISIFCVFNILYFSLPKRKSSEDDDEDGDKGDTYYRTRYQRKLLQNKMKNYALPLIVHHGSCHCQRVQFTINAPEKLHAVDIPSKLRFPRISIIHTDFNLLSSKDVLSMYTVQQGQNPSGAEMHAMQGIGIHTFCSYCGMHIIYAPSLDPLEIQINLDCLQSSSIASAEITFHSTQEITVPSVMDINTGYYLQEYNQRGSGSLVNTPEHYTPQIIYSSPHENAYSHSKNVYQSHHHQSNNSNHISHDSSSATSNRQSAFDTYKTPTTKSSSTAPLPYNQHDSTAGSSRSRYQEHSHRRDSLDSDSMSVHSLDSFSSPSLHHSHHGKSFTQQPSTTQSRQPESVYAQYNAELEYFNTNTAETTSVGSMRSRSSSPAWEYPLYQQLKKFLQHHV